MKITYMKKFLTIAVVAAALASCGGKKFHIEGSITGAADSMLYLENIGISENTALDSVRLNDAGSFSFAAEQPEAPEFYRLRIGDQSVSLSIDSTETITVKANYQDMSTAYEVEGSENCQKIKELTLKLMDLRQRAMAVGRNTALSVDDANDSILAMISSYKQEVKTEYIFPNPGKAYAYFALFQTLGNMLLFNPRTDADDIKVFAAVATSWDTYHPDAERGKNLHNIALEGMKNVRIVNAEQARSIDASKVQAAGIIDILLDDNNGRPRSLSELKGKVVLLDFHVFATNESPARILLLRELYNKYHAQGLEIYQVSLDGDEHFWKQQTKALPWISVRDPQGPASTNVRVYNVQAVPEFFLIDRGSNLVSRSQQISNLEEAVRKLL